MTDWAAGRAQDWLEHHLTGDDADDRHHLAALLREVALEAAAKAQARILLLETQKHALVSARVELTEAIGLTASILYRESASDKPSRQALRDRAVRLDQYLLKHRVVSEK